MQSHLFMIRRHLEGLLPAALPREFHLRTCQAGDETAWLEIVRRSYGGDWPDDAFRRCVLADESFKPERLFFAVARTPAGDRCVGTAGAFQKLFHGDRTGYVHMMAVLPEVRRRGLGAALLRACLLCFREQGWRDAVLDTDAEHIPAIRLYLAHGFSPLPEIEGDAGRWDAVLAALERRDGNPSF